MMFGNHGFMGGGFMWVFWIAVVVGIIFLVKWIIEQGRQSAQDTDSNPLDILKRRYARGEIDKEEYERKWKDLLS
jgi:putative membrane protein